MLHGEQMTTFMRKTVLEKIRRVDAIVGKLKNKDKDSFFTHHDALEERFGEWTAFGNWQTKAVSTLLLYATLHGSSHIPAYRTHHVGRRQPHFRKTAALGPGKSAVVVTSPHACADTVRTTLPLPRRLVFFRHPGI